MKKSLYIDRSSVAIQDSKGRDLTRVAASAFCKSMMSGGKARSTGLLPPVVRFISADGTIAVLERPPHYQQITYVPKDEALEETTFKIAVPWTEWVIQFTDNNSANIMIGARKSNIKSLNDPVHRFVMPNLSVSGRVCVDSMATEALGAMPLSSKLRYVLETFWDNTNDNNHNRDPEDNIELKKLDSLWMEEFERREKLSLNEALEEVDESKEVFKPQDVIGKMARVRYSGLEEMYRRLNRGS